jgi:hypothetical protein
VLLAHQRQGALPGVLECAVELDDHTPLGEQEVDSAHQLAQLAADLGLQDRSGETEVRHQYAQPGFADRLGAAVAEADGASRSTDASVVGELLQRGGEIRSSGEAGPEGFVDH